MKYVVSWTYRFNGSEADNEAGIARGLQLFSKWTPPASQTFHAFVGRLDGSGGFAVVETDDPTDLGDAPSKFGSIAEYQIFPVVDMLESAQVLSEGAEFRSSIG